MEFRFPDSLALDGALDDYDEDGGGGGGSGGEEEQQ
jgi:hypothetical protein